MPRYVVIDPQFYTKEYIHLSRSGVDSVMEDACDCIQAACGLVIGMPSALSAPTNAGCEQHDPVFSKTMRQMHYGDLCPAKPDVAIARDVTYREMKAPPVNRAKLKRSLLMFAATRDFRELPFPVLGVEAMRAVAESIGLNPMDFTPVQNRRAYLHDFFSPRATDLFCEVCRGTYEEGNHKPIVQADSMKPYLRSAARMTEQFKKKVGDVYGVPPEMLG